ncbi:MAG TPA: hypothetical protein VMU93_05230 [Caulobacteraceae bacterium]|nr:hypothetical protein [Caulobacteraceae bacterium]
MRHVELALERQLVRRDLVLEIGADPGELRLAGQGVERFSVEEPRIEPAVADEEDHHRLPEAQRQQFLLALLPLFASSWAQAQTPSNAPADLAAARNVSRALVGAGIDPRVTSVQVTAATGHVIYLTGLIGDAGKVRLAGTAAARGSAQLPNRQQYPNQLLRRPQPRPRRHDEIGRTRASGRSRRQAKPLGDCQESLVECDESIAARDIATMSDINPCRGDLRVSGGRKVCLSPSFRLRQAANPSPHHGSAPDPHVGSPRP